MYISIPAFVVMLVFLSMVCGCRNKPSKPSSNYRDRLPMNRLEREQRSRDDAAKRAKVDEAVRAQKAAYEARMIAEYGSMEQYEAHWKKYRESLVGLPNY